MVVASRESWGDVLARCHDPRHRRPSRLPESIGRAVEDPRVEGPAAVAAGPGPAEAADPTRAGPRLEGPAKVAAGPGPVAVVDDPKGVGGLRESVRGVTTSGQVLGIGRALGIVREATLLG